MSLSAIYQELHRRAKTTGEDRAHTFTGGARLAIRVRGGVTTLTIMRKTKRVGDTELATFRRDCNVPDGARRIPADGQRMRQDVDGTTWWYVAYVWTESENT